MKQIIPGLLVLALTLSLLSCLSVESELEIQNDGSGTLKLSYRVSSMVENIGRMEEGNTLIPLPLREEDFLRIAAEDDSIVLKDFNSSSDADYLYIDAEIEFSRPEGLSILLGGLSGDNVVFTQDEEGFTLTQRIYEGLGTPISEDAKLLLETYFSEDTVTCIVRPETAVREISLGEILPQGGGARYTAPVSELVQSENPVLFTVKW
ncbi:MAG: hypothetical protein JW760_01645 [Spirochaetales bacterium]|nr:hypothetical protein [Spirochaetales bacterium]